MKGRNVEYIPEGVDVTRPLRLIINGMRRIMTTDSNSKIYADSRNHRTEKKLFDWMISRGMWYELRQNATGDYDIRVAKQFYRPVARKLKSLLLDKSR